MLYRAKSNGDIGVKGCKITGKGEIYGYKLINTFFVDNSGFGTEGETALTFNKFLNQVKAGYYYGIQEAGQFQVYIGEYIKLTGQELKEYKLNSEIISSKKVKNNTRLTEYKSGVKILKLHNTDILKFIPAYSITPARVVLNSGGWRTSTTKSRLNEFLPQGIRVYQKNYEWYIDNKGQILDFSDNIEIDL